MNIHHVTSTAVSQLILIKPYKVVIIVSFTEGKTGCFPGGAEVKNLPASAGDSRNLGSTPGLGRSPRGNTLQHSCLENSMNRGVSWARVHGVAKSQT